MPLTPKTRVSRDSLRRTTETRQAKFLAELRLCGRVHLALARADLPARTHYDAMRRDSAYAALVDEARRNFASALRHRPDEIIRPLAEGLGCLWTLVPAPPDGQSNLPPAPACPPPEEESCQP